MKKTVEWLDTVTQDLWWVVVTMLVQHIKANPMLGTPEPEPHHEDLLGAHDAPPDLDLWARRSFVTLDRYIEPSYGSAGSQPGQLRDGKWGAAEKWAEVHRGACNDLYIRPVIAWLELQSNGIAGFHAGVERWLQRQRWFGFRAGDEKAYQEDFARFLFDSGFDMQDIGRETESAGGWVDFLLRGQVVVPVEFKVWNGSSDNNKLAPHHAPRQATRYAADYRVAHCYLVVVNKSDTHKLVLPPAGRTHDGVLVQLRVAEIQPPAPTRDQRRQIQKSLGDLGLSAP